MKFFVHDNEREGTAYHEFFKGKWDGETVWSHKSICLHDHTLVEHRGFYKALLSTVPGYDPYAISVEVSKEIWDKVRGAIPSDDMESIELYNEADCFYIHTQTPDQIFVWSIFLMRTVLNLTIVDLVLKS